MGYLNSFLKNQKAFSTFDDIGIDGVLIVDAPGEYSLKDLGISNANVVSISLVSPTTTKERTKKICSASSGFIYYVTLKGVTGSSNVDLEEIESNVIDLQKNTDLPVMAGFGIKNKEQAESISKVADGVVIGSYLVESIFQAKKTTDYKKIYNYLSEIKSVINK
jgi:tryptophan synthase alpha chain